MQPRERRRKEQTVNIHLAKLPLGGSRDCGAISTTKMTSEEVVHSATKHVSLALAALTTLSFAALSSQARENVPDEHALDEVIVTARLRSEKLRDVPTPLSVFTAADIEGAGIKRPEDFIALTPDVSVISTSEVADMQVNIRGINSGRDADGGFALIVDGVLLPNRTALNQEFPDIQQIEVLKGPQGALYGRNAEAGAIIVTTKAPSSAPAGRVTLGFGNNGAVTASAFYGGPLSDAISFRGGLDHRKTDGFFSNRFLERKVVDEYEENGAHARLSWHPNVLSTLDLGARYSRVSGGAVAFNAAFALPAFVGALGPDAFQNVNHHSFDYISNVVSQNEQRNVNLFAKGTFDLSFATLTTIGAYNDQTNFFLADGASAGFNVYSTVASCLATFAARRGDTPLMPPAFYGTEPSNSVLPPFSPTTCDGFQFQIRNQTDESAEVRLTSPDGRPLRWVTGLYYADINRRVAVEQGADLNHGVTLQAYNPPSSLSPTDLLYDDSFTSHAYAAFANIVYDARNNVQLTVALREDSEQQHVANNVPRVLAPFLQPAACKPNCFINPAYNVNPSLTSIPARAKSFSELQPKLSIAWKPQADLWLFSSYGVGYRSGGFNSQGSAATIRTYYQNAFGAQLFNVRDDFDRELAKSAEIGFKYSDPVGRVAVTGAAYRTKVNDMQFFEFFAGPFGLLRVVTNIDAVTINGAEAELAWRATDHLRLFGGASVTHGRIDANRNRPYTVGNDIPFAPAYLANIGAEATTHLTAIETTVTARVDLTATGPTWFHAVQDNRVPTSNGVPGDYSKTRRDAFALLNLRLSAQRHHLALTFWVKNLANKRYLQEVITAPEGGAAFIHDSPRRGYGLDLSYAFGE